MRVKIEKLDSFGRGITYLNNRICFVENALPGEIVDIDIIKEKSKYIEAKVVSIIEPSKDRIKVDCPYYDLCGGCSLRHLSYEKENLFKEEKVKDLLNHIGKLNVKVNSIISGPENNYRNKVTFHKSKGKIGYFAKGTKNIIPIDNCLLLDKVINNNIKNIKADSNEIVIRSSNDSSEVLMNGNNSIITSIGDKKYYLSKDSFFQVNKYLTKELYDLVRKAINKPYKTCLDLYCGTGTIGIYISDLVDSVIGIDYSESNIKDANRNIELNNTNNISFICDKVENKIDTFKDVNLVIIDPPRAGCTSAFLSNIMRLNPKIIIYISCFPETLSRDISKLKFLYDIKTIQPIDMFPGTTHVETVCCLYHQKKDFISVPYEPKDAEYLKQDN